MVKKGWVKVGQCKNKLSHIHFGYAAYTVGCAAYAVGCAAYAVGCATYAVGCPGYAVGCAAYDVGCAAYVLDLELSSAIVLQCFVKAEIPS